MERPDGNAIEREFQEIQTQEQASHYLDTIRGMYRDNKAEYRGRRNPEQQEIAEYLSIEADEIFEQAMIAETLTLGNAVTSSEVTVKFLDTPESEQHIAGGISVEDFRNEWRKLYVGIGVISNRLARDVAEFGKDYQEFTALADSERSLVADSLMSDFMEINAYRLGFKGFGLQKVERKYDENWDVQQVTVDRDLPANARAQYDVAARRGLGAESSIHTAGKMSPQEMHALRREFSEIDADTFFDVTGFNINAREHFESQG